MLAGRALHAAMLLRADVTDNDAAQEALVREHQVRGRRRSWGCLMSGALAPGPLPLTYGLLVALAGGLLGTLAGKVAGQHAGVDIGPVPLRIALVGLVSARLAFVVQLQDAYLKAPLAILDIRDGGWSPLAGLGAAALHAIVAGVRRPVWIIPLLVGLGTAGSVWLLGALSLSMMPAHSGELPPLAAQTLAGRELSLAGFRGQAHRYQSLGILVPPAGARCRYCSGRRRSARM